MTNQHLTDQEVTWNEHRQMSWFITKQCLRVAWHTFVHGLFPGYMSVAILPIFNAIMPAYYKVYEKFLDKDSSNEK